MITIRIRVNTWLLILLLPCALATLPAVAMTQDNRSTVPQIWQMLDYLATDYAGAVKDGAVLSASEYAEMLEFAGTARSRIRLLGKIPAQPKLLAAADALVASIEVKAAPTSVATQAHALADELLTAYPVPTAPVTTPDLARGAVLYQGQCASCHGASGHGDGPAGLALSPPPMDFTNLARADQRSALSLYEVVSQGVSGTAMTAYTGLSAADRWALAYYVGTLAYRNEVAAGAQQWQRDPLARGLISSPDELSRARVAQLAPTLGVDNARSILGYLRAHPAAAAQSLHGIALARARVTSSVEAYRSGARAPAAQFALSAYLDGVEPVEPQLDVRDRGLREKIEIAMGAYRTALSRGSSTTIIETEAARIDALLADAEQITSNGAADSMAIFVGALTILVREGLEALLIVVAIIAFLRKAERRDVLRYVHAGWIAALIAGGITWAIASYAVSISGAGRELTEGLSSLFAAAVLLSVGLWMHQKSIGGRWQAYLKEKLSSALNRRSAWFLFGLAFVSVYREVFETILFYAALWNVGQEVWLLAGIAVGVVVLALITWILLRTSRRLPISTFFSASSALIAVLAIVLTGKGVAALQEAGWVGVTVAPLPRIEILGIFPTWQTLSAQLVIVVLLGLGFAFNLHHGRKPVLAGRT